MFFKCHEILFSLWYHCCRMFSPLCHRIIEFTTLRSQGSCWVIKYFWEPLHITQLRHRMRYGDLLLWMSVNAVALLHFLDNWSYFVKIQPRNHIFQKFDSCVTDEPTLTQMRELFFKKYNSIQLTHLANIWSDFGNSQWKICNKYM